MSKFNPRVSIVIPVYNGSNYLREAIDSALAQTYKNIEIIVVNDGSIDNGATEKIAKSYGSKIRYFNKKNGGVATALNYGIKKMTGDYFSWLSHDDLYYPDKIESEIIFLKSNKDRNSIIPFSDYELIDDKSRTIKYCKIDSNIISSKPEYSLLRGSINGITLLIHKEMFDKLDVLFRPELKCTQDYDLWMRLYKNATFVHLPKVLVKTRIHNLQDSLNHPNAIKEGNELWINMMDAVPEPRQIELEGSRFGYYLGMYSHLKSSSYRLAEKHARKKISLEYDFLKNNTPYEKRMISVIIPCYNQGKYVKAALESVIKQGYDNYEIIIINDGSTDHVTNKILKNIKSKNVVVYHTSNRGVANARNYGYTKSKGRFILFLDADDIIDPNKFEFHLGIMLSNNNIGTAYSSYSYYDVVSRKKINPSLSVFLGDDPLNSLIYGWQRTHSLPINSPIFDRKVFADRLPFETDFEIAEDWIMWVSVGIMPYSFYFIGLDLSTYRIWNSSNSQNSKLEIRLYWAARAVSYIAENYSKIIDEKYFKEKQSEYLKYLAKIYFTSDFAESYIDQYNLIHDKLDNMANSVSWKITQPLRTLNIILKSIKKKTTASFKLFFMNSRK